MSVVNIVFGKSKAPDKFYYKGKRISLDTAFGMYQKKFRFTFGTIGHKGGKVNFGGTDVLFREFSELMDDASDKMPEGTYLALYDKLKKLKDETNKNTDDNYYGASPSVYQSYGASPSAYQPSERTYERSGLRLANDQWRTATARAVDRALQCSRKCRVMLTAARGREERWRLKYEELKKENKELEDKIKELEEAAKIHVTTSSSGPAPFFRGTGGRRLGRGNAGDCGAQQFFGRHR